MFNSKLRSRTLLLVASLLTSFFTVRIAYAQQPQPVPLAVSTFDVDAEGWTVTGDRHKRHPQLLFKWRQSGRLHKRHRP